MAFKQLNIAIIGYGRMGKLVEELCIRRGHNVICVIDSSGSIPISHLSQKGTDVAIEFTSPQGALSNINELIKTGIPVVTGTTGWTDGLAEARANLELHKGAMIYASNFSLGVNLFFVLNEYLAKLMDSQEEYGASINEIHHIHKKDAPSGTGITLANGIIQNMNRYNGWHLVENEEESSIPIHSHREGDVRGIHEIVYQSVIDKISITHEAVSREGFALGAVIAAEWLDGKTGYFTMRDVLGLK